MQLCPWNPCNNAHKRVDMKWDFALSTPMESPPMESPNAYGAPDGHPYRPPRSRPNVALATLLWRRGPYRRTESLRQSVTARRAARSEVLLDVDANARAALEAGIPEIVLQGEVPRLIDEWQVVPALWNHIRRAIDARQVDGQFILTGSAAPTDDVTRHTGAGRIVRLRMRPMSLFETGHSSGAVSLAALFKAAPLHASVTALTIADLTVRIAVGGWPANQTRELTPALRSMRDYVEHLCRTDINRVGETTRSRSPDGVRCVIRSLARNVATTATTKMITADATPPGGVLKEHTTATYPGNNTTRAR